MATFPLGRAVPVLLLAAAICLPFAWMRRPATRPDVLLWLPSPTHAGVFAPLLEDWRTPGGDSLGMERIAGRALNVRLQTMFMGGRADPGVPDLVMVEISQVGGFLRPPRDGVGFLPLDPFLDRPGSDGRTWRSRILASRLAPWSKGGTAFGIPFDLHPTALLYRADLWQAAGIDLDALHTWDEFHRAGLAFERHWAANGHGEYKAFGTRMVSGEQVVLQHVQRHEDVAGDDGPRLLSPLLRDTILRYARMVAGAERIGSEEAPRTIDLATQLNEGTIASCLAPDWRVALIRGASPGLAGKLRLRPLPVFTDGDVPTTTMGGMMIAITRVCPRPEAAWQAIERLLLSPASQDERMQRNAIMPALPEHWPRYDAQEPDAFFAGQRIGRVFADLAPLVPPRHAGPALPLAMAGIANVLNRARARLDAGDDAGLEVALAGWLADEQAAALRALHHGSFE